MNFMSASQLELCPNLIGGEWVPSKTSGTPVYNPSTGDVIAECPVGSTVDANAAVEAAQAAFPARVPLWMYPIAIACGNTFVLKPSEKVPLTAIKIAKLLEKAGLPKGVLNIVHGGREVVDALLTHPKVKAISFVGSTPIAKYIFEVGTKHGKRVQSNGGAKNYVLLMPDADLDNSVRGLIGGAFV